MTPGARTAVALALGSFVLYNANVREISSQDTVPNRVLPYEVLEYGRLDLDRLFRGWPADAPLPFWIQRVGTHYRSNYPVVPALLAVPVYAGPVLLGAGDSWPVLNALSKLAASLFAALSVAFVYLAARELARRQGSGEAAALATAAVYALATPTWAIASQGLWGHGPAQLGLAVSLWAFLRPGTARWGTVLAGLATGVMVASRPSTGLVAAALAGFAVLSRGRAGLLFAGVLGAVVAAVAAHNLAIFGSVQGGYAELHRTHAEHHGVASAWSASFGAGLARCPREPESRALHLLASAPVPRGGTCRLACPAPRRAPGMRGRRRRGRHRDHRAVLGVVGRPLLRPPPSSPTSCRPWSTGWWPSGQRSGAGPWGGGSSPRPSPPRSWSRPWAPSTIRRLATRTGTRAPRTSTLPTSGSGTGADAQLLQVAPERPRQPGVPDDPVSGEDPRAPRDGADRPWAAPGFA